MSYADNSYTGTLPPMPTEQPPVPPKQQQFQQPDLAMDPNTDPTLLSTMQPIHQPGYQTNQQLQPPIHYQPPLPAGTAQQQQQQQPVQSSLPHQTLPAQDAYHLEKLRREQQAQQPMQQHQIQQQPMQQQQVQQQPMQQQPMQQQPYRTLDPNQTSTSNVPPVVRNQHQKVVEQLPAATLNDPNHPESLPTEYKVAPRTLERTTDIDQHYKHERDRRMLAGGATSAAAAAAATKVLPQPPQPNAGQPVSSRAQVSPATQRPVTNTGNVQKPKLFQVVQALLQGRLPTNAQLDHFLTRAMTSPSMEARAHMLSPDGQALYEDLKRLLQTLRGVIYEKNEQELFQNLIYHCQSATDTVAAKQPSVSAQAVGIDASTSKTAQNDAKEILERLVTVAKLVTTNAEFRSVLSELTDLAREIFGEGADKLSVQAKIAGEKLGAQAQSTSQQIADAAQNNQGRIQQNIQAATDQIQETLGQARDGDTEGLRATRDDMKRQSSSQYETARKQAAEARANLTKQAQDAQAKAKDKAVQLQSDAKVYAGEKMPPERRQALVERLKIVLGQIQADPQYQTAIDSIIGLLRAWRQRAESPRQNIAGEASKITEDANVNAAAVEFKVLLQRWAQGYSLDPLINQIQWLWEKAHQDPELRQYLDNISHFVSKAVREPNYVTNGPVLQADTDQLIDQGQALMNVKYRPETESLVQEARTFVDLLNTDPRSREVSERIQGLAKDLLYDKKGQLAFKVHLLEDMRYVLLPALLESFESIPIPRIEYADLKVDLMLDNMILVATDLMPRLCEMAMHNTIRMLPRNNNPSSSSSNASPSSRDAQGGYEHNFKVLIAGVQANLKNIEYAIHTKTGFKVKDHGRADLLLGKKGVDVMIHGVNSHKAGEDDNGTSLITFKDVSVKIHSLNIKVHKSDHRVLLAFAQPFIKTAVKRAIAKSIETQLREALVRGDKVLATSIRDQRIKTGKNTAGALVDTLTSFVTSKVHPDEKAKATQQRQSQRGHYDRTSHVVFDREGLQVLDPIKHTELKVGAPLLEDPNEMAAMGVKAPWISTAFNMHPRRMPERETMPGMRQPRQVMV
ncbi:hypothetical protein DFQ26_006930 [Actinomortierella ambigua]|nr:hypothetical protein DFQ26_006930 [Actinomortierella ambigua]